MALALAVVLAFVWLVPSRDYLFVPHTAQPLADKVTVEGEKPPDAVGGIYFVDVVVRKASWAERLLPFLRPDGSSLVDRSQVVPPDSSFEQRRREGRQEMARSEEVAAAVALKQAGFDVRTDPQGALVEGVASDVPAAAVLDPGDVIVRANGAVVRTPDGLRRALSSVAPGATVRLTVRHGGSLAQRNVRTVESPSRPGRAIIGIRVAQAADVKLPVKVQIDLGNVGGPSAGLPFALDVLQELGYDVDRGLKVAATGEIELDGTVAPIGGVKQKVFGARRAGVDVILVPAGDNAAEARRYAGNLRVVPVRSFQQALSALRTLASK